MGKDFTIDDARKIVIEKYSDSKIGDEMALRNDEFCFTMQGKNGKIFELTIDSKDRFPLVVPSN